jgi:serine/threonine protein kinase
LAHLPTVVNLLDDRPGEIVLERLVFDGFQMVEMDLVRVHHVRQLVEAIAHIHAHDVAHCDLKLENFMLDSSGAIKLIDFGLAHSLDLFGLVTADAGTAPYKAPELNLLPIAYDARKADMWSLGVCIFALVHQTFPFKRACNEDWRYAAHARAQIAQGFEYDVIRTTDALLRRKVPSSTPTQVRCVLNATMRIVPAQRIDAHELGRYFAE